MVSPQRNQNDITKTIRERDIERVQESLKEFCYPADQTETGMLRSSRQGAEEVLLRNALKKIKQFESQVAEGKTQLDTERKKSNILDERFKQLAANHHQILVFVDDYKREIARLGEENHHLRSENDTLFSAKLQDAEAHISHLTEEISNLQGNYESMQYKYQEKISGWKLKYTEQKHQHEAREASLFDELHDTREQLRDLAEKCNDLKRQLSMEREKAIQLKQEKHEEMMQLETKWILEEKARIKAEDKYKHDVASKKTLREGDLQCALDESMKKYENLIKDFNAYKEHSTNLLTQEKELNAKLRHLVV